MWYSTTVPPPGRGTNVPRIRIAVRVPLASLKPEESARLPDMKPCIPVRSRSRHSSALNLVIIDPDLPITTA